MDGTFFLGNNTKRHGDVAAQFRQAGVSAAVIDDQQSVADKIRAVAALIGDPDAGEELAAAVEDQLARASETAGDAVSELRVLVVTSSGAGGANAVVGSGTAAADILEAVGAVNCGVEAGLRGYSVEYSDEGLLDLRPDVIITGTGDVEEWGGLEGFLTAFPTLARTPAGEASNFVLMPSEQIKVSGSAVGAGALELATASDGSRSPSHSRSRSRRSWSRWCSASGWGRSSSARARCSPSPVTRSSASGRAPRRWRPRW